MFHRQLKLKVYKTKFIFSKYLALMFPILIKSVNIHTGKQKLK